MCEYVCSMSTGDVYDYWELVDKYDNLIVTQTFSKSRSLAGARLGFGIASEALICDMNTIKYSTNPYNVNRMTMMAGYAALCDNEYYMSNCKTIEQNREYTRRELERLGFSVLNSSANFLFAKSDRISGEELYLKLKNSGILVRHFKKEKIIITDEEAWERVDARVTEGPFVIKHKGLYYLTYSANHTRSQDYAVGYAVSASPFGPFEKYEGNPILHKNDTIVGVGHHSFAKVGENKWICAYHSHFSTNQFRPRVVRLDYAEFSESGDGEKDVLVINGPTGDPTL